MESNAEGILLFKMLKIKIIFMDLTKSKKGSVLNRRKRGEDGA